MKEKIIKHNIDKFLELQEDLNYKIYRWWTHTKLGSWWIDFRNGIKQLFKWRKTIYNQRDWDYYGIYTVLEFKIQNLRDGIKKRDLHTRVDEDVRWMDITLKLLERVKSGYYSEEHYQSYDVKLEFIPIPDNEKSSSIEFTPIKDELDIYFNMYPKTYLKTLQQYPDIDSRSFIAGRMGDLRHEKARRLLFKILAEKIEYWWD
jgi:hypothetical protein